MFNAANRKRPRKAIGSRKTPYALSTTSSSSSSNSNANTNDNDGGSTTKGSGSIIKSKKSTTPPTTIPMNGIDVHFPFTPYDVQKDYMTSVLTALQNSQHALLESPTGTGKTLCLLCSALAWQQQEKGKMLSRANEPEAPQPTVAQPAQLGPDGEEEAAIPVRNTNKPPVIIYASRTHSQLSQVVNELRNTRYRPKHAVLGSREHMCIHPRVNPTVAKGKGNAASSSDAAAKKTSTEVNNGCSKLCKERKCMFRNTLEERAGGKNGVWQPPSKERVVSTGGSGIGEYEQPVLDMEDLVAVGGGEGA